jgi:O-antigen/teichoic acid export membrane protein
MRRFAGQSALLFAGFTAAQACALMRNALLGHLLSKGDFGIAATITLTLQVFETLTDAAADRFLVQADDGESPQVLGAAHAVGLARAVLIAAGLWLAAPVIAGFFLISEATGAFQLASLALLVKGFVNLDYRLQQRRLDNRGTILVEVAPQVAALALTYPLVLAFGYHYEAVVSILVVQAAATLIAAQLAASRPWQLAWDRAVLVRLARFGWPIWLGALPLLAVFQGDRAIIARFLGMEQLAAFTAAFLLTMVPSLIASRVAFSLLLPMLAAVKHDRAALAARLAFMSEAMALLTGAYLIGCLLAGGPLLRVAFGGQYSGLDAVVAALAVMWAARMLQAAPATALMALGQTRIYLIAGLLRAAALPFALALAVTGAPLAIVAMAGAGGEVASFLAVAWALRKLDTPDSGAAIGCMARSAGILALAGALGGLGLLAPWGNGLVASASQAVCLALCLPLAAAFLLPGLGGAIAALVGQRRRAAEAAAG